MSEQTKEVKVPIDRRIFQGSNPSGTLYQPEAWDFNLYPCLLWRNDVRILLLENPVALHEAAEGRYDQMIRHNESRGEVPLALKPSEEAFSMLELVRTVQALTAQVGALQTQLVDMQLKHELEYARQLPAPVRLLILSYLN